MTSFYDTENVPHGAADKPLRQFSSTTTRFQSPTIHATRTVKQVLSPVPLNRRSFSRASVRGDETPLASPMPLYPRRRSVTFVGEETSGADGDASMEDAHPSREERPFYHTATADSASKVPPHGSHNAVPEVDLENTSLLLAGHERPASILVSKPAFEGDAANRLARTLPTPRKGVTTPLRRSASRAKLEARRQQATLDHTFYDDSFVEEFVSTVKSEEAKRVEAEAARVQAASAAADEAAADAARRAAQHKEASTVDGHQPNDVSGLGVSSIRSSHAQESSLAVLARLAKEFSALAKESAILTSPEKRKSTAPIGEQTAATTLLPPPPKPQVPVGSRRQLSMVIPDDGGDSDKAVVGGRRKHATSAREAIAASKREARLQKVIQDAMMQYRRSKSKRSVMLIDLNDIGSDADDSSSSHQESASKGGRTGAATVDRDSDSDLDDVAALRAPITIQRKRARSVSRKAEVRRLDSRPQLDDDSDDGNDGVDTSSVDGGGAERPVLLSRGSRKNSGTLPAAPASRRPVSKGRRLESEVDAILGVGDDTMLPRAPPPSLVATKKSKPSARSKSGKHNGKNEAPTNDTEETGFEAAREKRGISFIAPYSEPVRIAATSTISTGAQSGRGGGGGAGSKRGAGVPSSDPFAHFFNLQFDSPGKLDDAIAGTNVRKSSGNGGLMLPSSCRGNKRK